MPNNPPTENTFINGLVTKAIDRKKSHEKELARKLKPKLELVLLSQFEILETLNSKNGRTTLYHLIKKDEPNQHICCKVINENTPEISHSLLLEEASRLELSQHPGVIDFIKLGTEFDRPYLMYEWVNGESLAQKLDRYKGKGFRADHVAWLVYQLAGALEYMHTKGICHLDIKPANIIISEEDTVKLIDFGSARYVDEAASYAEVSMSYASPKYIESGFAVPQDDVYALAMLAGHLLLGDNKSVDWHASMASKKRPSAIPKHIWALLRNVIDGPRAHGLSPISFAQKLAQLDLTSISLHNNDAPLFVRLRNADLVLSHRAYPSVFNTIASNKLESALGMCAVALVASMWWVNRQPILPPVPENPVVVTKVEKVKAIAKVDHTLPAKVTASFLSQPPWQIEHVLNEMNHDELKWPQYYSAYQIKDHYQRDLYFDRKNELTKRTQSLSALSDEINNIRRETNTLNVSVARHQIPNYAVETKLNDILSQLDVLAEDAQQAVPYAAYNGADIADWLQQGQSEKTKDFIQKAWASSQAYGYYYSHVLPEHVAEQVVESAKEYAQHHFYSKAIDDLNAALEAFGPNGKLTQLKSDLTVQRSEYVLSQTASGGKVFTLDKVERALDELHALAPEQFNQLKTSLMAMAAETLNGPAIKGADLTGARLIQQALKSYQPHSQA
ncbi:protein kinase [Vibrio profundum]|uniref:serine/threonine protein kinase n=1 Tax=Vibrio profundum TaxID=2910247 RepID=UPI003D0E35C3